MPRKPPSLSSFAPELKQAWLKASTEPVLIKLKAKNLATALRHRLYKLREALRAENDPLYLSARDAIIRVYPAGDGEWHLLMEPSDAVFKGAITEALGKEAEVPPLDFDLPETIK